MSKPGKKRFASKKGKAAIDLEKNAVAGTFFAVVRAKLGNGSFSVDIINPAIKASESDILEGSDDQLFIKRMEHATIRGTMRKRQWVNIGDIVLISPRDIDPRYLEIGAYTVDQIKFWKILTVLSDHEIKVYIEQDDIMKYATLSKHKYKDKYAAHREEYAKVAQDAARMSAEFDDNGTFLGNVDEVLVPEIGEWVRMGKPSAFKLSRLDDL